MVKKLQKLASGNAAQAGIGSHLGSTVKDSAQQIWLAGLGAFAKAQDEGGKVFDALVKEGLTLQRKTQSAAEEKISEATSKMSDMANEISSKVTEIGTKATGQWDKLESIFEERVSKVLQKLGVPAARDVDALLARIDTLHAIVAKLSDKTAEGAKAVVKSVAKVGTPQSAAPVARKRAARPASAKAATTTRAKPAVKAAAKAAAKPAAKAPAKTARKTVAAK